MTYKFILEKAKELISVEERWCKGDAAQDENGNTISPVASGACKWCPTGAIEKVTHDLLVKDERAPDTWEVLSVLCAMDPYLISALDVFDESNEPRSLSVEDFNDLEVTSHPQIMELFEVAISRVPD